MEDQFFRSSAMIAHLNIRQWTGRKYDKRVSATAEHAYNAATGSIKATKKLMDCPELKAVHTFHNNVRLVHHYNMTSPWLNDGGRIISAKMHTTYTQKMRELKDEAQTKYIAFWDVVDDMIEKARRDLNSAFNILDYPSPADMRTKFGIKVIFSELPNVNDFRVNLATDDIEEIKSTLREEMENAQKNVMADLWGRLYEVVSHMAKSLEEPDKIFRDSLVYNVVEVTNILPKLNYMDNPELNAMVKQIQTQLCSTHADTLRHNPQVRELVADEAGDIAKDIKSKMAAFAM
jgi:hypothetical protein